MVESTLFIGAAIIAITQAIKFLLPTVNGAVTIGVAMLVGALVAIFHAPLGVANLSVAQGIMTGLFAAGVHTTVTNRSTPAV